MAGADPVTDDPADAEGVGAFGPNFEPPVGMSDDQPCSQATSSYDVLVQQNRDSADFQGTQDEPGEMGVVVIAGSSAENGDRGPGPFVGDMLGAEAEVEFIRTR